MSKFLEASNIFEEKIEGVEFYEARSSLYAKNQILNILEKETKQPVFLIGEPGSGKSFLLRELKKELNEEYLTILIDTPFVSPVDFIRTIIKKAGNEPKSYALMDLIKQAQTIFKTKKHIIMIDEAQLLSKEMMEAIRILSDSKSFWFILAMHKMESQEILKEPHFRSRPHRVVEIGSLTIEECEDYIVKMLISISLFQMAKDVHKNIKLIYKLSNGNFRSLKKIFYHLFLILDYTHKHDKKKYQKISKCLIIMASIDGGLIDV